LLSYEEEAFSDHMGE